MASAVARPASWVSSRHVDELSQSLGEPEELRQKRTEAFERFQELPLEPNPLYRGYGYFTNVDLSGLDAVTKGPAVPLPPAPDRGVRVVHDAAGTRAEVPGELLHAGVKLTVIGENTGPDGPGDGLLGTEEPADRLSALSTALVNRGYRLEIPAGLPGAIRVRDLTVLSTPHEALAT